MLQLSTINSKTLELLKFIMSCNEFEDLKLVGGTALALQLGHRKSIDLDFFGKIDFEDVDLVKVFGGSHKVVSLKRSKNINIFSIDDIKVDFVNYAYPYLKNEASTDRIRLASMVDIAAMKLAAITGRGSKKDFIDIYFLLRSYSLKEMIGFYQQKYFDGSVYLVLKSLTYFDDAEKDMDVEMLTEVSWPTIKSGILEAADKLNQTFL